MSELQSKAATKSFWISLAYVGIGTTALLSNVIFSQPSDFIRIIVSLVLLICFPAIIIGFGIIWGGGEQSHLYALIAQVFVFFGVWGFMYIDFYKNYLNELRIQDHNTIKEAFDKLALKSDLNSKQLWCYTFKDKNQNSLIEFSKLLGEHGFITKSLKQNEDGTGSWLLELEKEDLLTPELLSKRNIRLGELIKKHHVASYQGWDLVDRGIRF